MKDSVKPGNRAGWRRARISLNPGALAHNLEKVRENAPHSQIMAVIKANAYGHGLLSAAAQLDSADMFAVAMPGEALALRQGGCDKPLLVLHGCSSLAELQQLSEHGVSVVVHQQAQLDMLQGAELPGPVDVWLKVDTGMHRAGISPQQVSGFYKALKAEPAVASVFLMSHFANADEVGNALNNKQIEMFVKVTSNYSARRSMANSAAILSLSHSHFDIVRPGIMLYGSSPFADCPAAELGLEAVMQFEAPLLEIKTVPAGESIGYGSRYRCEVDTRVGLVAAGYADGYPRHAGDRTPVWLNGQRCPLLGRVSMDSLCIDLTGVDAAVGDRVVLWGRELPVDEVAQMSETIAYELLCHAGVAADIL